MRSSTRRLSRGIIQPYAKCSVAFFQNDYYMQQMHTIEIHWRLIALPYSGWPRHRENRENREFGSYFFQTGKTQEFCSDTGKNLLTQGKYLDCDYLYVNFFKFQKFLPHFARHSFSFQSIMYIWPHMLCVQILPVYLLSVMVYSCIIFIRIWNKLMWGGVILK